MSNTCSWRCWKAGPVASSLFGRAGVSPAAVRQAAEQALAKGARKFRGQAAPGQNTSYLTLGSLLTEAEDHRRSWDDFA